MKLYLKSKVMAVLIIGLFAGGILLSQAMGWWATESKKVARKITTGEFAGQADPADIRGSYSFADVEKNFGIPVKVLARAFGFEKEADPSSIKAKDLEARYGAIGNLEIGTDSLRVFVAAYVGIPYPPKEGTGLLESAFLVLKEAGKLDAEREKQLKAIVVKKSEGGVAPATQPAPDSGQSSSPPTTSGIPSPSAGSSQTATEKGDSSGALAQTSGSGSGSGTSALASGSGSGSVSKTGAEASGASSGSVGETTEPLIKGKTTFKEVLAWGVTKAQIEKVLGKPMPPEGTVIKDWCTKEGLEFGTIRDALLKLKP